MTADTHSAVPEDGDDRKKITLNAVAEDFAIDNERLRQRLLLRSSQVDELRAVVGKLTAALEAKQAKPAGKKE